jgi:hypothetical protein
MLPKRKQLRMWLPNRLCSTGGSRSTAPAWRATDILSREPRRPRCAMAALAEPGSLGGVNRRFFRNLAS